MHPAISQHRPGIVGICQRYGIRRLEVFGSAARANDFDPAHSDADFLVEFASGVQPGLNAIFGAKADLVIFDAAQITEGNSFADPCRHPQGIEYVFVNGVAAVSRGVETGALSGRVLRKGKR